MQPVLCATLELLLLILGTKYHTPYFGLSVSKLSTQKQWLYAKLPICLVVWVSILFSVNLELTCIISRSSPILTPTTPARKRQKSTIGHIIKCYMQSIGNPPICKLEYIHTYIYIYMCIYIWTDMYIYICIYTLYPIRCRNGADVPAKNDLVLQFGDVQLPSSKAETHVLLSILNSL